jgi:hypothetical protein
VRPGAPGGEENPDDAGRQCRGDERVNVARRVGGQFPPDERKVGTCSSPHEPFEGARNDDVIVGSSNLVSEGRYDATAPSLSRAGREAEAFA